MINIITNFFKSVLFYNTKITFEFVVILILINLLNYLKTMFMKLFKKKFKFVNLILSKQNYMQVPTYNLSLNYYNFLNSLK